MDVFSFIKQYEAILKEKKISKTDFYRACGISSSAVSQWKSGITSPSRKTIERICEYLNLQISFYDEPETKKDPSAMTDEEADNEIHELLTELRDNPNMRMLMHSAKGVTADQIKAVAEMLMKFKGEQ